MKINTAVIPVAGKGTRFLPATKNMPKELIPIINKPMIHYAVEEAVLSGIDQVIFVTSSGKHAIEDYFDRNLELEQFLERNGKKESLSRIKKIGEMIEVVTVRQKEQLGLGHAIKCAEQLVGKNSFAVILGDDLVLSKKPVIKQLMEVSEKNNGCSVVGVMEVPQQDVNKYGIIDGNIFDESPNTYKINKMIEKPLPENAPTNLATPGRYVFDSNIFQYLNTIEKGVGGEYQLTDAINEMALNENVLAYIFEGDRYDTGSINGYLEATVEFALRDPDLKDLMLKICKEKINKYE